MAVITVHLALVHLVVTFGTERDQIDLIITTAGLARKGGLRDYLPSYVKMLDEKFQRMTA